MIVLSLVNIQVVIIVIIQNKKKENNTILINTFNFYTRHQIENKALWLFIHTHFKPKIIIKSNSMKMSMTTKLSMIKAGEFTCLWLKWENIKAQLWIIVVLFFKNTFRSLNYLSVLWILDFLKNLMNFLWREDAVGDQLEHIFWGRC